MDLKWFCFLNRSGYAQASLDYLKSLWDFHNLSIKTFHSDVDRLSLSSKTYFKINSLMNKEIDYKIKIYHCVPDNQLKDPNIYDVFSIGFGTFETFDPPEHWIKILKENNLVLCPSQFNMHVFKNAGLNNLHYLPHCIDFDKFNQDVQPLENKNELFNFMFVGTWKKRKCYPQLIEAWIKEFDSSDKVRLIIKSDKYTEVKRYIEETKNIIGKKDTAEIYIEGRVFDDENLPKFYKNADCLINPTMGEGFGLPGLQFMSLGIPIITTNFSGVTDYSNENNCTFIEPQGFIMHPNLDNISQFNNKKWAHITVDEIRKKMRYVVENKEDIKIKAKKGYLEVREKYSYEHNRQRMKEILNYGN